MSGCCVIRAASPLPPVCWLSHSKTLLPSRATGFVERAMLISAPVFSYRQSLSPTFPLPVCGGSVWSFLYLVLLGKTGISSPELAWLLTLPSCLWSGLVWFFSVPLRWSYGDIRSLPFILSLKIFTAQMHGLLVSHFMEQTVNKNHHSQSSGKTANQNSRWGCDLRNLASVCCMSLP